MTILKNGSAGAEVKELQNKLISAGYNVGNSGADGVFGSGTESALKAYQQANGLASDGVANYDTQSKLGMARTVTSSASGPNTSYFTKTSVTPYDASKDQAYQQAISALQTVLSQTPEYKASYDGQIQEMYNKIVNRDKFEYDVNADMLYKQLAEQYQDKGRLAMTDTLGQAAALTGGYSSTYAQSVGQQQYDAYLKELTSNIPDLYNQAYQRYQDEGDEMVRNYGLLWDRADDEYQKYLNSYDQWEGDRDYAQNVADQAYDRGYNAWAANQSQFNADRDYEMALKEYQLAVDKFNYQKEQDAAEAEAAAQAAAAAAAQTATAKKSSAGSSSSAKRTSKTAASSSSGSSGSTASYKNLMSIPTLGGNQFNNSDYQAFKTENGGSGYSAARAKLVAMKQAGASNTEANAMLSELFGSSYISQQEYMTLMNNYRNNKL